MWYSGLSIGWTDDKLQTIVKLIVGDEEFDDIGGGGDCGLKSSPTFMTTSPFVR